MVSEFVFFEDDATKDEKTRYLNFKLEVRQLLKDDFNRKVFAEILMDLRKDLAGTTQQRIFKLYKELELHKDAYDNLNSWRWQTISKGILELTQMHVEESYDLITKFINDKRATIRKQAEIASVSLKQEGISYFLDTTRCKISEWQQLKLLDVIRNFEDFQPPRFKAWLTSSNRYVVLFALRLIKHYRQNDVNASLIELVKHKNNHIKVEALKCIKEFNLAEAKPTLKIIFWECSADVKVSILDVIATIGNQEDIEFLKLIDKKVRSFSVKSKARSTINAIAPESILPTEDILDISNYHIPKDIIASTPEKDTIKAAISSQLIPEAANSEEGNKLENITEISAKPVETLNGQESEKYPEEEIVSNEKSIKDENALPEVVTEKDIIAVLNIDFLPIVVGLEASPKIKEVAKDSPPQKKPKAIDLHAMEVYYEEVKAASLPKSDKSNISIGKQCADFDISLMNFLPLVVKEKKETDVVSNSNRYRFNLDRPKSIETQYISEKKIVLNEEKAISNLYAIPVVFEIIGEAKDMKPACSLNPNSIATIDEQFVRGLKVSYEEVAKSQNFSRNEPAGVSDITWNFDEINTSNNTNIDMENAEDIPLDNSLDPIFDEELQGMIKSIPNSRLYSGHIRGKMELLDDIEELGDKREIPLLVHYLSEEPSKVVKKRIREIIGKFSYSEVEQLQQSEASTKKRHTRKSTVEMLFQESDHESRILLLDHLGDIMDQADVPFLQGLLQDKSATIREKAEHILEALRINMAQKEESKSIEQNQKTTKSIGFSLDSSDNVIEELSGENNPNDPKEGNDIFEIDFQVISEEDWKDDTKLSENDNLEMSTADDDHTLLGCLRNIQHKIFEKFSG